MMSSVAAPHSSRSRTFSVASLTVLIALLMTVVVTPAHATGNPTFDDVPVPVITGTPKVGVALTATHGESQPAAETATLEWIVSGVVRATGATFTPQAADRGLPVTVRLTVTAEGLEPGVSTSAPTANVAIGTLASFKPTISGTAGVGKKLTVKSLPTGGTYAYVWKRDGKTISGARAASYTLTTTDLGKRITVTVSRSVAGYSKLTVESARTATVKRSLTNTPSSKITGSAKVGGTLTASQPTWSPTGVKFTYQWLRDDKPISGATARTYKPKAADQGKKLSFRLTGAKSGYVTVAKTTVASAAVAKGSISIPKPTITGTVRAGSTLTARVGTVTPSGAALKYQWHSNGHAIAGATKSTFALKNVHAGAIITVKVTASQSGYANKTVTSAATAKVAKRPVAIKGDGTYKVGTDIKPGTYFSTYSADCEWERRSNSGVNASGVIVGFWGVGRVMVTISSTDAYFRTWGCGNWTLYDGTGVMKNTVAKDGIYVVGVELAPGFYVSDGTGYCWSALLSDASGSEASYLDFYSDYGPASVTIDSSVKFFETIGCGTWTRIE